MKRILNFCLIVALLFFYQNSAASEASTPLGIINVAVLGLGGRVQGILLECLKLKDETHKEIRVIAVCDNHSQESLKFFTDQLIAQHDPLADAYKKMFANTSYYPDTELGINQLFENHKNLERIFITSSNDRHLVHLNSALTQSACKNIFIEKPIFRNLAEYTDFTQDVSQATIHVGLTLRYATMTKIAAEKLKEYKLELGPLFKVESWEHVNFPHGFTIIMMNWRRYRSLSGGLLLEKSVHDLDLALFFMEAVDAVPQSLEISTAASHDFYKKSRKNEILDRILQDDVVRKRLEFWDTIPWQRVINFSYDAHGTIDWQPTLDAFFNEFPADDTLATSDIIPDRQNLTATMLLTNGNTIDFSLKMKLNGFSLNTERGTHFFFKNGNVIIDIEHGKMSISLNDGTRHDFDLRVNNASHAGGDKYVAHTILGTLPAGQHKAMFNDPAVQLSTVMGLISEEQASHNDTTITQIKNVDNKWVIEDKKYTAASSL